MIHFFSKSTHVLVSRGCQGCAREIANCNHKLNQDEDVSFFIPTLLTSTNLELIMIGAEGRALAVGKLKSVNIFKLFVDPMDPHACMHLEVSIEGPGNSDIATSNFGDGTIEVEYSVEKPGKYAINVTFQNQHIKGSPFKLLVK